MSSSALELSILKLTSPRKRLGQSARYTFENDLSQSLGTSSSISPKGKATGSPAWFADDDLFTIFEQHRAAIPFKWEASPGTRRDQAGKGVKSQVLKDGLSDSEQENSSASSPTFTLSPSSSTNSTSRTSSTRSSVSLLEEPRVMLQATPEFLIKPIQPPSSTTSTKDSGSVQTSNDISELIKAPVSKRQPLALRPPPGMQSIKQLLSLECGDGGINTSCFSSRSVNNLISSSTSNGSSTTNLKSHHRRSFRKDGLKALPFLSAPKEHGEDFLAKTTMLGFEEWSKVVQQQEKQEKQQHQETADIGRPHHRTLSMPRLAFSFKKKSTTETESGSDLLDADFFFNEDFGKKGGLRERRPLSSVSSRISADGYTPKTRNWVFDNDVDYSDSEEYFDSTHVIAEEDEKEEVQNSPKDDATENGTEAEIPQKKRKNDALGRLKRIFKSSDHGNQQQMSHQKPARLSSVAPAPPPPVLTQSELKLKKSSQHNKQVTKTVTSPILKMCMSNPIGQALLKNVRQLRSFEFHISRPRTLTMK